MAKDNGEEKEKKYCLHLLDLVSSEHRFVSLIVQQIK